MLLPKYRLMLSEKLQPTVLVVPHDQDTSRLYTFYKASKDYSVRYYRCWTCKRLSQESAVPGRTFHVLVKIKGDELETENETHHPFCSPTRKSQIRATEIHRSCKLLAKEGIVSARTAFEQAVIQAASDGHTILAEIGSWKQVRRSYFDAAAQGKNSLKRLNDNKPRTSGKRAFGSVDLSP